MSELVIELDRAAYAPGETITGVARWSGLPARTAAALALGWWTEGPGDRDSGLAGEEKLSGESGRKTFSFVAPDSPCSVNGVHVSVKWAVALRAGEIETRAPLVIGPGGLAYDISGDIGDSEHATRFEKFFSKFKPKTGALSKTSRRP